MPNEVTNDKNESHLSTYMDSKGIPKEERDVLPFGVSQEGRGSKYIFEITLFESDLDGCEFWADAISEDLTGVKPLTDVLVELIEESNLIMERRVRDAVKYMGSSTEEKNPWISVEDRLPDTPDDVLIHTYGQHKEQVVGRYHPKTGWVMELGHNYDGPIGGERYPVPQASTFEVVNVTHWQPLLKPPTK